MRFLRPISVWKIIARTVLAIFLIGGFCEQSSSQTNPASPVDEFGQEYKKVKDSLEALPEKIDATGRKIDQNTNPATTKSQIDILRATVSTVLAKVADNGPVPKMGKTALSFARSKLNEMEQDTHFSNQQREYLKSRWKNSVKGIEAAEKDLDEARTELANLLKIFQANDDFIQELETLSRTENTIKVLQTLTNDMHEISNHLKIITDRMSVPSM